MFVAAQVASVNAAIQNMQASLARLPAEVRARRQAVIEHMQAKLQVAKQKAAASQMAAKLTAMKQALAQLPPVEREAKLRSIQKIQRKMSAVKRQAAAQGQSCLSMSVFTRYLVAAVLAMKQSIQRMKESLRSLPPKQRAKKVLILKRLKAQAEQKRQQALAEKMAAKVASIRAQLSTLPPAQRAIKIKALASIERRLLKAKAKARKGRIIGRERAKQLQAYELKAKLAVERKM